MKIVIAALMLVSATAMANNPEDFNVKILSYCDNNNNVVTDKEDGTVVLRMNCTEQGLVCRDGSRNNINTTIYYASCQAK